ncbi:hypothetical protein EV2_037261 [Malus domestica]
MAIFIPTIMKSSRKEAETRNWSVIVLLPCFWAGRERRKKRRSHGKEANTRQETLGPKVVCLKNQVHNLGFRILLT